MTIPEKDVVIPDTILPEGTLFLNTRTEVPCDGVRGYGDTSLIAHPVYSSGSPLSPTVVSLRAHGSCPSGISSGMFCQGGNAAVWLTAIWTRGCVHLCRGGQLLRVPPCLHPSSGKDRQGAIPSSRWAAPADNPKSSSARGQRGSHKPWKAQARGSAPPTLSVLSHPF